MPDAKETLKEWCNANKLSEAKFSPDGSTLSLGDTSLPAQDTITIEHDGKKVEYTIGSIYLQVFDPHSSLLNYRKSCQQHQVNDPVKPIDKPVVVGYFLPSTASASASADSAPAEQPEEEKQTADTSKAPEAKEKEAKKPTSSSASRDKDKHRSSSSSSKDHKKRPPPSHHKDKHRDKHAKKHRTMVTNEQLFSNLNVVVDKRAGQPGAPAEDAKKETTSPDLVEEPKNEEFETIRKALSPEGFQVTQEMLEKHKDVTETLIAHEIPVGNSASVLRASSVGANLTRILNMFVETVNPKAAKKSSSAQAYAAAAKKNLRPHLIGKKPIILLPKGMTAPVTMMNGYEFFANARYYPRDAVMKNKSLQANIKTTTFTRRMPGVGPVEYELLDNPRKLQSREDWDRVVAVVVLGHSWQFKDWPGKYSDPVQLFSKVFGFYIGIEGDKLPSDLQGWACQQGILHRDKRGLDSVTHASFWNSLDEWMKIHKPELIPRDRD